MRPFLIAIVLIGVLHLALPAAGADDGGGGLCSCSARHPIGYGCSITGPCPCECHCPIIGRCGCSCGDSTMDNPPAE